MGFLDRLKGGGKVSVSVVADPAEALPGDEVRLYVTVSGEIDDKAQAVRAGVRCLNEYLTKEWDREDDEWDTVWRSVSLHEEARDLPLEIGEHSLTFTVPTGLPPHSAKAVTWSVWANVDRRRGIDASDSKPLPVRLPSAGAPQERRDVPAEEDGVGFLGVPASVGAGQTLDGVLTVTPSDDVKASGVRVKLRKLRSYADSNHQMQERDDMAEVEVSGSREFAAGQTVELPFSLTVPPDPGPTAKAPHSNVEWFVMGIVDRRMRGDLEGRAPLVVHDGP
jgi:sporulation-control protein spo0M